MTAGHAQITPHTYQVFLFHAQQVHALATAQVGDPTIRTMLATEVGAFLVGKVAGKRLVTFAGRRIPVVGGVVGAGADGFSTWSAGRFAAKEFRPRRHTVVRGETVA